MQFETTVEIDAAPQDVWAVLVDVRRWPEWTDSMQEVSWLDGATATVGARARVKQPDMPALTWAVTELDPGRSFSWETSSVGVRTHGSHAIAAIGDGRSRLTLGLHQSGALAGPIGVLTGSRTRRFVRMEAEGLKRAAEARRATQQPPATSAA
jgi:uncharacterized protein YndB with AHSA1/START domain